MDLKIFYFCWCVFYLNPKTALHLPWVPSLYNGICPSVACLYGICVFYWIEPYVNTSVPYFAGLPFSYLFSILPGLCGIYCLDEIVTCLTGDRIFIHKSFLTSKALNRYRSSCPRGKNLIVYSQRQIKLQNNGKWPSQVASIIMHPRPLTPKEKSKNSNSQELRYFHIL